MADYAFDFEGNRVKFTDGMYNDKVQLMQDKKSKAYNPWAALFQGNKRAWAEYSIFVMIVKAFLTLGVVFMVKARLRQAMLTIFINFTWFCVLNFATPYISLKATYTDISSKSNQILTLGMGLTTIMSKLNRSICTLFATVSS